MDDIKLYAGNLYVLHRLIKVFVKLTIHIKIEFGIDNWKTQNNEFDRNLTETLKNKVLQKNKAEIEYYKTEH